MADLERQYKNNKKMNNLDRFNFFRVGETDIKWDLINIKLKART